MNLLLLRWVIRFSPVVFVQSCYMLYLYYGLSSPEELPSYILEQLQTLIENPTEVDPAMATSSMVAGLFSGLGYLYGKFLEDRIVDQAILGCTFSGELHPRWLVESLRSWFGESSQAQNQQRFGIYAAPAQLPASNKPSSDENQNNNEGLRHRSK